MRYDERNPLSPNYRRPEPELMPKEPSIAERVIVGLLVGLLAVALQLAGVVLALSLMYGIVLLIFRHAFGVELPNPYWWFR
jgi:hypothetical protein